MEVGMKKLIVAAVVLVLFFVGSPVFAQEEGGEQEGTASGPAIINIPLDRVWPHHLGFIVQYRRPGNRRFARAYLPMEWFASGEDNRAEVITLPPGSSWPSMTVFFMDGEFSHVRLYLHRMLGHSTWGFVPQHHDLRRNFENVETLELRF